MRSIGVPPGRSASQEACHPALGRSRGMTPPPRPPRAGFTGTRWSPAGSAPTPAVGCRKTAVTDPGTCAA